MPGPSARRSIRTQNSYKKIPYNGHTHISDCHIRACIFNKIRRLDKLPLRTETTSGKTANCGILPNPKIDMKFLCSTSKHAIE